MQTECNAEPMLFARLDRRELVADFGGGAISSDAGALLLGATDRAIGLVDRFTACFADGRDPGRVVHELPTLVGQRVFGMRVSDLLCNGLPVHAERKGQRGRWERRSTTNFWTSC
jgi:Transposase DDE domain group 1